MPTVGAKFPIFAPIKKEYDGEKTVYGNGVVLGRMINVSVAESYAVCSALANRKQIFDFATVTLGVADITTQVYKKCFGSADINGNVIDDGLFAGVPGGFGYITAELREGSRCWCVHWIKRIVFTPPSLSAVTKGRSLTFTTPSIIGIADADGSRSWRQRRFFDDAAEAIKYLKTKAGVV